MKKQQMIVLLIAAIIAVTGAFFAGKIYLQKATQVTVVVAKETLYPGHIVMPSDVTTVQVSSDALPTMPGALTSVSKAVGRMLDTVVIPGEYISDAFFAGKNLGVIYMKMLAKGESLLTVSGSPFNLNIASLYPGAKVAIFRAGDLRSPICYGRVIDFSGRVLKGWSDAAHGEYKGDYVILAVEKKDLPTLIKIMPNVYLAVLH